MSKVNYAEIGAEVASAYTQARQFKSNAEVMQDVMDEFGIENKRSLMSYLSSKAGGKVYVADAKATVGSASSVRKVHLVRELAEKLEVEYDEIASLEKATKSALEVLLRQYQKSYGPVGEILRGFFTSVEKCSDTAPANEGTKFIAS